MIWSYFRDEILKSRRDDDDDRCWKDWKDRHEAVASLERVPWVPRNPFRGPVSVGSMGSVEPISFDREVLEPINFLNFAPKNS